MADSDENTHPSVSYTSSSRNSRRSSSLFQLHGGSLLDVIGDNNLPFILPESLKQQHALPSPPKSDSSNDVMQRDTRQAPEMHEPEQGDNAVARISSTISNERNAANSFERWDSQPTDFPRPAFVFAAANRCAQAAAVVISTSFPPAKRHAGTITVAATTVLAIAFLIAAAQALAIALHSLLGAPVASLICATLPYNWKLFRHAHSFVAAYLPDFSTEATPAAAAAAAAAAAPTFAAEALASPRANSGGVRNRRWTLGGSLRSPR